VTVLARLSRCLYATSGRGEDWDRKANPQVAEERQGRELCPEPRPADGSTPAHGSRTIGTYPTSDRGSCQWSVLSNSRAEFRARIRLWRERGQLASDLDGGDVWSQRLTIGSSRSGRRYGEPPLHHPPITNLGAGNRRLFVRVTHGRIVGRSALAAAAANGGNESGAACRSRCREH
jgi:hypothetical protein